MRPSLGSAFKLLQPIPKLQTTPEGFVSVSNDEIDDENLDENNRVDDNEQNK